MPHTAVLILLCGSRESKVQKRKTRGGSAGRHCIACDAARYVRTGHQVQRRECGRADHVQDVYHVPRGSEAFYAGSSFLCKNYARVFLKQAFMSTS